MRLAGFGGEAGGEVGRERGEIVGALAQRRQVDREDIEPVVEVLAELAGLRQVEQAAVGGGDERGH